MMYPVLYFIVFCALSLFAQSELVLFDFENDFDPASVNKTDAQATLIDGSSGKALDVTLGHQSDWPGVILNSDGWDLSGYQGIAMDITNPGTEYICVFAETDNDNTWPVNTGLACVGPGETRTLFIFFYRDAPPAYLSDYLWNMNGMPGGYLLHWELLDLTAINKVRIYNHASESDLRFTVDNIRASGSFQPPTMQELESGFFPFVDEFGQYIHDDWPGKTKSEADITLQHQQELTDLRDNPGPLDWNSYGGWTADHQLAATGHFRVQKYQDKWWLVDPAGRLFWSQGIVGIKYGQSGPSQGREHYFTEIPENMDFHAANLQRKFGTDWNIWTAASSDIIHTRLRSWGINTIANWSNSDIYDDSKTPYVVNLASGMTKDVPEQLDEAAFRATVRSTLTADRVADSKDDPFCLGYFVDNELHWPGADAGAIAETYYKVVKEELKALAPDKLYLGSRIHSGPDGVYIACAVHCDVVSVNRYRYSLAGLTLPAGALDKPMIIGEFHFGALDRGLPHTGLRSVIDQEQRSRAYSFYVTQALNNDRVVGAHWFTYIDQLYTGRGDGENYQIGFVDVADRPYPEMVAAARDMGEVLYPYRLEGIADVQTPRGKVKLRQGKHENRGEVYDLTGRLIEVCPDSDCSQWTGRDVKHGVYLILPWQKETKKVLILQ